MLTKIAYEYELMNKMAEEEQQQQPPSNTVSDIKAGAKFGGGMGALGGGLIGAGTGAVAGGPLGALLGAPVGAIAGGASGAIGGGIAGIPYGVAKDVFNLNRPEGSSNLVHDTRSDAMVGAGLGAIGGAGIPPILGRNRAVNALGGGVSGGLMGGLFGLGTGYIKDRDERRREE